MVTPAVAAELQLCPAHASYHTAGKTPNRNGCQARTPFPFILSALRTPMLHSERLSKDNAPFRRPTEGGPTNGN